MFSDPNALPANFFNVNSPRGVVFSTPGTSFLVSANSGGATPILFGFPNDFNATALRVTAFTTAVFCREHQQRPRQVRSAWSLSTSRSLMRHGSISLTCRH
jgi:hypothetical protein